MSLPSVGAEPCGVLIKMLNSGEKPMGQFHQKNREKASLHPDARFKGRIVRKLGLLPMLRPGHNPGLETN